MAIFLFNLYIFTFISTITMYYQIKTYLRVQETKQHGEDEPLLTKINS